MTSFGIGDGNDRSQTVLAGKAREVYCQRNEKRSSVTSSTSPLSIPMWDPDYVQAHAKKNRVKRKAGRCHRRAAQGAEPPKQSGTGERLAGIGTGGPRGSPPAHRPVQRGACS